jgi:hypothetical protein
MNELVSSEIHGWVNQIRNPVPALFRFCPGIQPLMQVNSARLAGLYLNDFPQHGVSFGVSLVQDQVPGLPFLVIR